MACLLEENRGDDVLYKKVGERGENKKNNLFLYFFIYLFNLFYSFYLFFLFIFLGVPIDLPNHQKETPQVASRVRIQNGLVRRSHLQRTTTT